MVSNNSPCITTIGDTFTWKAKHNYQKNRNKTTDIIWQELHSAYFYIDLNNNSTIMQITGFSVRKLVGQLASKLTKTPLYFYVNGNNDWFSYLTIKSCSIVNKTQTHKKQRFRFINVPDCFLNHFLNYNIVA